jgi:hypothetical protein
MTSRKGKVGSLGTVVAKQGHVIFSVVFAPLGARKTTALLSKKRQNGVVIDQTNQGAYPNGYPGRHYRYPTDQMQDADWHPPAYVLAFANAPRGLRQDVIAPVVNSGGQIDTQAWADWQGAFWDEENPPMCVLGASCLT